MEHVNTTNARQQQQQHQQLQQHQLEQQQQHNENQQQFCLRWHNHQTSLLSTLPILLDQSHLTDVTISAEGRLLRAHRVVLSACSSFFMEIFRALEASNHPVIIIPGASFGAIVALLTFMYSGEVNVYEEQIPMLLNLAETLGIKGLADVQNNNLPKTTQSTSSTAPTSYVEPTSIDKPLGYETPKTPSPTPTPTPTPTTTPNLALPQLPNPTLQTPLLANKLGTPLENFFFKSLQFYPNLLPQPLNFSQTALNKTTELLAKYQQQCQLYQNSLEEEDCYGAKRMKTGSVSQNNISTPQPPKDVKRIDKIVENLRTTNSNKSPIECGAPNSIVATSPVALAPQNMSHFSPQLPVVKSSPSYNNPLSAGQLYSSAKLPSYSAAATPTTAQQASHQVAAHHANTPYITPEDHAKLQQHIEQYAACQREAAAAAAAAAGQMVSAKSEPNLLSLAAEKMATPSKPPSNSKLYATCFICHKQLSNQYNLRVHLETHQNVRYACNVCSHVSRSKDALRKHVSYRHPGAPSPCENEARRKRVTKLAAQSTLTSSAATATAPSATATSADVAAGEASVSSAGSTSGSTPGSLSTNPYLFLPNQFQLAAAAAAVAVAESNTTPALDLAHEVPMSMKSSTPTANGNGEADSEAGASAT
ncbi:B-cell CLL/lymphoma 6 member B protein [Drosophila innubila]|uniref:B-cell CLL/lymphoma 6 member B protein n=1 Tax=Drosophila innubila TaxID=198719 RepID=UPI00148E831A|nr:B-cell CLL/lymphoma 6 member B protein [Drosophila innubila]